MEQDCQPNAKTFRLTAPPRPALWPGLISGEGPRGLRLPRLKEAQHFL